MILFPRKVLYSANLIKVYTPFMKVTDDNKGCEVLPLKPTVIPIQSGFIPLVAGSLKDQITLLVILFSIFLSQQKSAETSNRLK